MASYTVPGMAGLAKEGGTARSEVIEAIVTNAGGQVEAVYFAFGQVDLYVICEVPDNVTAAALGIAVRAAGGVDAHTVPLLTAAEVDAAARLPVAYQPPAP
ncbi:GYD domain-containing protein [Micromonospora sp. DT48]|uniref:GYD domain-containing protein n=1 Tax=unclassified Micromonospora TaxID=2617518 RepID=UPI0012BB993C|nr:GYD domain-containing protein [Micromonospora sp. CP22]MTK01142.1 GYD domain-containing protein [Micromonospora sp. CP22]